MTIATALISSVNRQEHRMMRRLNRWHAPRWLRVWMTCATKGGDGWLWSALGVALLLFGGSHRFEAIAAAAIPAFSSIPLYLLLKRLCGRRRPCHIEPHAWANLLPPDRFSFPSGHTMTAFAICVPLSLAYPGLMPVLLFCALSVAASRLLLGMHFLTDVLVGALVGGTLGYLSYWLIF